MTEPGNEQNESQESVQSDAPPSVIPEQKADELTQPASSTVPAAKPDTKQTFLQSYLKKAGKIMLIMTIIGCCFLMFAAWLLISTFDRILTYTGPK